MNTYDINGGQIRGSAHTSKMGPTLYRDGNHNRVNSKAMASF